MTYLMADIPVIRTGAGGMIKKESIWVVIWRHQNFPYNGPKLVNPCGKLVESKY
jgi:hypothetical protein